MIKQWRKKWGLTQAKAAEALGLHYRTLQDYELGLNKTPRVVIYATKWLNSQWSKNK